MRLATFLRVPQRPQLQLRIAQGQVTKIGRTDTGDRMSFAPRNLAPAGAEG